MNLIKCENNHFYDSEKFLSCPHCANKVAEPTVRDILGEEQKAVCTDPPEMYTALDPSKITTKKTVGWLVCISGTVSGESFCLREGENHIGRTANMDIALLYEPTISRKTHAVITYKPEQNSCILYPKNSAQTFCNGRVVKTKRTLKNWDVITLGTCTLVFIAFCDKVFSWDKQGTANN